MFEYIEQDAGTGYWTH